MKLFEQYIKDMKMGEIPEVLYHGTLKANVPSIMKYGLGAKAIKMWSFSRPGVTYLTDDETCAFDFVYNSEYAEENGVEEEDVVVLEIDATRLDAANFEDDENIKDEDVFSIVYNGVIPSKAITRVLNNEEVFS